MAIRVLDADVVGRIAAGEVVERPSSVVKELLENAIDAGATAITVEMRGGGIDYLRVTDNGCGIEPNQVRLAFENHATSKLQNAEQLDDIRTLGFRGEALPSIASVAKIEMTTRAKGQESGVKFTMEGGENAQLRETGCPQGTTIIVRDLFYNVPVRRSFLNKAAYEGGRVSDVVSRMMVCYPDVSIRFVSGGSTLMHSFGDGNLRHAMFAVYGRVTAELMDDVDASEGGTHLKGLIGVGELSKPTRIHQLFFVNGRLVRCPMLSRALETVCKSRVTIGMVPMCALHLTVPPSTVEVNVHPNKLEVRFRDEQTLREVCERLMATAYVDERVLDLERLDAGKPGLERHTQMREIGSESGKPDSKSNADQMIQRKDMLPTRDVLYDVLKTQQRFLRSQPDLAIEIKPENPSDARSDGESGEELAEEEPPMPSRLFSNSKAQAKIAEKQMRIEAEQTKISADMGCRVIGTVFRTYILVETENQLLLIDQHAAHERLNYEKLKTRAEAGTASQQLLMPLVLRLSSREWAIIEDNLDMLESAGYHVEPFGDHEIRVTAVPFVLGKAEIRLVFMEMLESLTKLKSATVDVRRDEIMQMACKSAIKAGDPLPTSEIESLIRQMKETGAPPTCPHGRPVVKALSRRDLEKMFKRVQ